ncbi:hypothetical protein BDZ97DRAFT_1914317 [Flammula alnicola]|nr:hypothetical protein BDZ97DRAFT_1914317 [Flammula alnicola]
MRFFSLFTFATLAFSAVSAAPVSKSDNGIVARDNLYLSSREIEVLEARAGGDHKASKKYVPPPPPKVTFEKGVSAHSASNHMDKLNLHGDSRKQVEGYHRHLVEEHMKTIPGAHTAVVKNLAHAKGSRDPHIHVSAEIRDKGGNIITAPRRGNPLVMDPTHHIYTNAADPANGYHVLPHAYKKAVDKHNAIGEALPLFSDTKGTATLGELMSISATAAVNYTNPVFVVMGEHDLHFCGGNCYQLPLNGFANFVEASNDFFPAIQKFDFFIPTNIAHGINLHFGAPDVFLEIQSWIAGLA